MEAPNTEIDVDKLSSSLASDLNLGLGGDETLPGGDDTAPGGDDTVTGGDDTVTGGDDTVQGGQDTMQGAQRGPDGKFIKAAPAATVTELPVPKSWAKEMHPIWDKLAKGVPLTAEESRKAATYYNEREGQMAKGAEGYRSDAEYGRALKGVLSKHDDILKQHGLDAPTAVEFLFNSHRQLSNPDRNAAQAYLGLVAQKYGLKLEAAAAPDPNAPKPDPALQALQDQVRKLTQTMTQRQEQEFQAHREKTANDVNTFADAKDEKGNPKSPYFEECADHICTLLKGDPNMTLEAAYQAAVWANPVTRQKELNRLQQETETENRKKAEAAAQKAKRATSTNVRGRDTNRAPQAPAANLNNLDEVMTEVHEEIKQRA